MEYVQLVLEIIFYPTIQIWETMQSDNPGGDPGGKIVGFIILQLAILGAGGAALLRLGVWWAVLGVCGLIVAGLLNWILA